MSGGFLTLLLFQCVYERRVLILVCFSVRSVGEDGYDT